ncbi:DUF6338 family protein [Leifsonia sp. NPDC058292]|uniref:DUF6338 family protein n=1 Tax=Leifsonia sp. NPDC058292 TaxID=3346428 RepID=UPI0036DB614F
MPIPQTAFALVVLITLVVPGLVYALVRTSIRGFRADDQKLDSRIAQALVVSVILDSVYLIILGRWFADLVKVGTDGSLTILDPIRLGCSLLLLGIIVPAIVALVFNLRRRSFKDSSGNTQHSWKWLYRSTPTAWDAAFTRNDGHMVRVRLPGGRFVGGYFGEGSYISTYPEPRDLYLSHQFVVDDTGAFGDMLPTSRGVWIRIPDGAIVEFLEPQWPKPEGNT